MSTFLTNIGIPRTEKVGPNTNSRDVTILHPDMHRSSETGHVDAGKLVRFFRRSDRTVYLPDKDKTNLVRKDIVGIDENGMKMREESECRYTETNVFKNQYLKDAYGVSIIVAPEELPDNSKPLVYI